MMDEEKGTGSHLNGDVLEAEGNFRVIQRRQNFLFLLGLFSFACVGAVAVYYTGFVGVLTNSAEEAYGDFGAESGVVTDQARNPQAQHRIDKNNSKSGFKFPWDSPKRHSNYSYTSNNWTEHIDTAWAAQEARWNRTHPGQPFPLKKSYFLNGTTYLQGKNSSWQNWRVNHEQQNLASLTSLSAAMNRSTNHNASGFHTGNPREDGHHEMDAHKGSDTSKANVKPPVGGKNAFDHGTAVEDSETADGSKDEVAEDVEAAHSVNDLDLWLAAEVTKKDGKMYEIVKKMDHDKLAFTQGLTFYNGKLYESTGLYGESTVRILNPETGAVQNKIAMRRELFGEGLTYRDGELVQLTWKAAKGFVYNANNLVQPPIEFTYETTKKNEGWGLTNYEEKGEFIVTDGSSNLVFWDMKCVKNGHCPIKRTLPVLRIGGIHPARNLNEIEFWRGKILANIWFEDVLLVIDPETGKTEKEYDFASLWPKNERKPAKADVFNGISTTPNPDTILVTGKQWDRMFEVRLLV